MNHEVAKNTKNHKELSVTLRLGVFVVQCFNAMHNKLSEREEYLATQIVDIGIKTHKGLGPGLLESVYEKCFVYELQERGISFQRQKEVRIIYKNFAH